MAILYPPILPSSLSAFVWEDNYRLNINYRVPVGVSESDYDQIRIKIVKQENNKSIVLNYEAYLTLNKTNPIEVPLGGDSTEQLEVGKIYKVQLAFYNSNNKVQSEWSQVMAIKAIGIDKGIGFTQLETNTLSPLFQGYIQFSSKSVEWIDKYRFTASTVEGELIEDSEWLQANSSDAEPITYRFSSILKHKTSYIIGFSIVSNNGYQDSINQEVFIVQYENMIDENYNIEVRENHEDGFNDIYVIYKGERTNTAEAFMVSRCDETTNFIHWEDCGRVGLSDLQPGTARFLYRDYTIESGMAYKYAIQLIYQDETKRESRTGRIIEDQTHTVYLQYAYLYSQGKQLKLKYNNKTSSFKHTTLATKQDTLGSRYPTILRNGNAYYAEFPVTGLISLHMDDNETFFQYVEGNGYYFENNLVIPDRHKGDISFNTNLTGENIYIERKFREKVEDFLHDGGYKLYRSPTEGNFIVILMNVSLTPNQQLGRMISEFSSTAYEVAAANIKNLNSLDINPIGNFPQEIYRDMTITGHIKSVANENIISTILDNIEEDYKPRAISSLLVLPSESGLVDSIVLTNNNNKTLIPVLYSTPLNIQPDDNGNWPVYTTDTSDVIIQYTIEVSLIQDTRAASLGINNSTQIELSPTLKVGQITATIEDKNTPIDLIDRINSHDCDPNSEIGKIYEDFYDLAQLFIEITLGDKAVLEFIYSNAEKQTIVLFNKDINYYYIPIQRERIDKLNFSGEIGTNIIATFKYIAKKEV